MATRRLRSGFRQQTLTEITAVGRVFEVTEETAVHYATIRLELKRAGKPIPTNDLWIAALCREHRFDLLSRDLHFDSVPGLQRLGW